MAVVLLAGAAAGTINTVVGTGSLVSFPTLLALGVPPVVANASNTTGLVPGGLSGTLGYRCELTEQGRRLRPLLAVSVLGGVVGATLLLVLHASAFEAIVPVLVLLASVLVAVQPALSRRLRARAKQRAARDSNGGTAVGRRTTHPVLTAADDGPVECRDEEDLQVVNALKNATVTAANTAAALVFVADAQAEQGDEHDAVPGPEVAAIDRQQPVPAHRSRLGRRRAGRRPPRRRLTAPALRVIVVALGLLVAVRRIAR